jgi:hypothetical protein
MKGTIGPGRGKGC